jgi:FlaA1/EpsC-like NDP-sugar epimerase
MIVVTGAAGSIGQALLMALPDAVGIDIDDWDITQPRLNEIESQPDLVYHLAAAKDAPEGELDPEHVLRVNALGTANVLARWPNARVILASTCKACDPETAYGASKLIAERMVLNRGGSVARFHNVRQTRGNVFETWAAIPEGDPIPATSCTRYFIDIEDAVYLLAAVATLPPGRYLFEPGQPWKMTDVARLLYPSRDIVFMPRRRGDRLDEPLVAAYETLEYTELPDVHRVGNLHDAV